MFIKVVTNKIKSIRHLKLDFNWLFGNGWKSDIFPETSQNLNIEMPAEINQQIKLTYYGNKIV